MGGGEKREEKGNRRRDGRLPFSFPETKVYGSGERLRGRAHFDSVPFPSLCIPPPLSLSHPAPLYPRNPPPRWRYTDARCIRRSDARFRTTLLPDPPRVSISLSSSPPAGERRVRACRSRENRRGTKVARNTERLTKEQDIRADGAVYTPFLELPNALFGFLSVFFFFFFPFLFLSLCRNPRGIAPSRSINIATSCRINCYSKWTSLRNQC